MAAVPRILAVRILLWLAVTSLVPGYRGLAAQEVVFLPASDSVLGDELQLMYEIGGLDGPAWAEFQEISDAAFAPDGGLYLLDAASPQLVALSPQGAFRHFVGAQGGGPGEYLAPAGIAVMPNSDLVVFDASKRAFLRFGSDGTAIEEVRPDFDLGVPTGPFAVVGKETVLSFPMRMVTGRLGHAYVTGSGIERVQAAIPLLRTRLEAANPVEIVAHASMPQRLYAPGTSVIRAFEPEPSFAPLRGNRVALFDSERYELKILAPDGTLEKTITRPLDLRPTDSRDREAYQEFVRERNDRRPRMLGSAGNGPARMRPPEPAFYPVITPVMAITGNGGGLVWVLRRDSEDPNLPGRIDLVSLEGTYVGSLPAHRRGLPSAFGPGGLVVFLEHGEYDVPIARTYRLPPHLR